jgi:hypothetical protein
MLEAAALIVASRFCSPHLAMQGFLQAKPLFFPGSDSCPDSKTAGPGSAQCFRAGRLGLKKFFLVFSGSSNFTLRE